MKGDSLDKIILVSEDGVTEKARVFVGRQENHKETLFYDKAEIIQYLRDVKQGKIMIGDTEFSSAPIQNGTSDDEEEWKYLKHFEKLEDSYFKDIVENI